MGSVEHPGFAKIQGAGCRVQGTKCRVQGAECRVQGAGCKVQGARCKVQGAGCVLQGLCTAFVRNISSQFSSFSPSLPPYEYTSTLEIAVLLSPLDLKQSVSSLEGSGFRVQGSRFKVEG